MTTVSTIWISVVALAGVFPWVNVAHDSILPTLDFHHTLIGPETSGTSPAGEHEPATGAD